MEILHHDFSGRWRVTYVKLQWARDLTLHPRYLLEGQAQHDDHPWLRREDRYAGDSYMQTLKRT